MTKTTKKSSAKRKLIPAVGMLTTSAIMLSSATYAWFTMNKEVEVTGLQMEAVAGDALEISLGASVSDQAYYDPATAPTKEDSSWKRSVDWQEAYKGFAALKPASSDDAKQLMAVDENGVTAGGMKVADDTIVSQVDNGDKYKMAKIGFAKDAGDFTATEDDAGYYIDVPMWIRTNKTTASASDKVDIDCTVTITKGSNGKANDELMNSVRVAILPVKTGTNGSAYASVPAASSGAITVETGQQAKVFGLNNATYSGKVLKSGVTGAYGTAITGDSTVYKAANALIANDLDRTDDGNNDANVTPKTVTFSLDSAEQNDYSGCAFIVRIWLEGESYFCKDANANQDWRVDLHFDLCDGEVAASGEGKHSHDIMASNEKTAVTDETPEAVGP